MRMFSLSFALFLIGCPGNKESDTGPEDLDNDGYAGDVDCDDGNTSINPGAIESCDGIDNDCDEVIDNPDAVGATPFYQDSDADGYGSEDASTVACTAPTGYVADATDCDDGNASVFPGAPEPDCTDPVDYNCDGSAGSTDEDGDGYKACEECDDQLPEVNPGAAEVCDGLNRDENCNGVADDDDSTVDPSSQNSYFADTDGDGYGDDNSVILSCDGGGLTQGGDCNDSDAAYNPGAIESDCTDPNDYNCDGFSGTDDNDGDGYPACAECNDADATINPGGIETCDGVDQDCDGTVDEDVGTAWYTDADADGYGDPATAIIACTQPTGTVAVADDCNDADPAYNPAAVESDCTDPNDYNCDGSSGSADNDNDGLAACEDCDDTDAAVGPTTTWYTDADADGYGDLNSPVDACALPAGASASSDDCNDADATTYPGASDVCDSVDNDCNGVIDDGAGSMWYTDADTDGYGDASATPVLSCSPVVGSVADGTDCNDADSSINPAAAEICDSLDNNCDGSTDEAGAVDGSQWYMDADADGYGDVSMSVQACTAPSGYVPDGSDCDDTNNNIYPFATEYCNGSDDNCDGTTDEDSAADAPAWYLDADADSYGDAATTQTSCSAPTGYVSNGDDCDDGDAATSPAAFEVCDSIDNDCNGSVDDNAVDAADWYLDGDGDGYGAGATQPSCSQPAGTVADNTDCDDGEVNAFPGNVEACDGFDNNCDGAIDEAGSTGETIWYADADGDSFGDASVSAAACTAPTGYGADASDCDDTDNNAYPGNDETCDSTDNDCDGSVDENSAVDAPAWYVDADGDSYGGSTTTRACTQPAGTTTTSTDCNDSDAGISPGADEYCDSLDNNCDGNIDENTALDASSWYVDADGDGYGGTTTTLACSQPANATATSTDCNDGSASISPGASEYCDGVDNDCDGSTDENTAVDAQTWYVDADADTWGSTNGTTAACSQPTGYAASSSDCDDAEATVNPSIVEGGTSAAYCEDGLDNDCDGVDDCRWAGIQTTLGAHKTWTGINSGDELGGSVGGGGDLNGDGYADVALGAPGLDNSTTSNTGRVYIFHGSSTGISAGLTSPSGTVSSTIAGDAMGSAVTILPDIDADGDDELLIGIRKSDNGTQADAGSAILVRGSITSYINQASAYVTVKGARGTDYAGSNLAIAGDQNSDNKDDWMTGAPQHDGAGAVTDVGRVAIYSAAAATGSYTIGSGSYVATISGTTASGKLGSAIAGNFDFNGDGTMDVAVGAPYLSSSAGEAYIYFGPLSGALGVTDADITINGAAAADELGNALSSAGDNDGDGFDDLVVAAHKRDSTATDAGTAFLFLGDNAGGGTLPISAAWASLSGTAASDFAGRTLAYAGDVDANGYGDFLVAATGVDASTAIQGSGAVGLVYGPTGSGAISYTSDGAIFAGISSFEALGVSLAGVGDVNGDLFDDFLAGSNTRVASTTYGGSYLFLGTGE